MDAITVLLCLAPAVSLVAWLLVLRCEIREARGEAASASSAAKSQARRNRVGTPRMMPMPAMLRNVGDHTDVMGMN
jgi:hypothetical protein